MNYTHDIETNISTSKSFTTITHKSPLHFFFGGESKSQCIALFPDYFSVITNIFFGGLFFTYTIFSLISRIGQRKFKNAWHFVESPPRWIWEKSIKWGKRREWEEGKHLQTANKILSCASFIVSTQCNRAHKIWFKHMTIYLDAYSSFFLALSLSFYDLVNPGKSRKIEIFLGLSTFFFLSSSFFCCLFLCGIHLLRRLWM